MVRSPITCHVLDSSLGKPAADVAVSLEQLIPERGFIELARGTTDADGRASSLLPPSASPISIGVYRMTFETGAYFASRSVQTFYPRVEILFNYSTPSEHYHVPLLLSPHSYTTYRGS